MYEYSCKVTRVVDGDTVDVTLDLGFNILHKCRVRLYGIDTPESRTRDKDEKARGLLAKQFILDALEESEITIIQTKLKDSKGKFGRVLGDLMIDGISINGALCENNLAVPYYGQSKADVEASHLVNRQKLIDSGIFTPVVSSS
tara:strand:+ start:5471 stop:5902 length:432 start_codon:yes stop_codon:yes gene_type:complete